MKRQQVNPTSWQEKFGFSQGWRVDEPNAMLFVAGQGPIDETGQVVGEGDFEAQVRQTFVNVARVLEAGGMSFEHVVQLGSPVSPCRG